MGKVIKWLALTLIGLCILIAIVGMIAARSVDPASVKNMIEEQTFNNTGLTMHFNGDLNWSFFPTLSLDVNNIELHTAKTYAGDTLFANIGSAKTSLALRHLLTGNIRIDQVALEKINLRLVTDTKQRSNWKDIEAQNPKDIAVKEEGSNNESANTDTAEHEPLSVSFQQITMNNIQVDIIDQSLNSQQTLRLDTFNSSDLNFSGKSFPVDAALSFKEQDSDTLKLKLATNLTIELSSNQFNIQNLNGNIEETSFSGQGNLLLSNKTQLNLTLNIGKVDLNRFIPQTDPTDSDINSENTPSSNSEDTSLPLAILHTLNTQLKLSIDSLTYQNTQLEQVQLNAKINNGILNVNSFNAKAFDGDIIQSFTVDANQQPASITAQQTLQDIQIDQLLASNDIAIGLKGRATFKNNVNTKGNSINNLLETLKGQTQITITDGVFLEDNLEHRICQAIALTRKTSLTQDWPKQTQLNNVVINIAWNNGVGNIRRLEAGLPNATINGQGNINLTDTSYDLRILGNISGEIKSLESNTETGCEINQRYRDIAWPLRCKGSAEKTDCGIDNSRLDKIIANKAKEQAKESANKELNKQKEKLKDKLNEKLGDDLNNKLQQLFR